MSGRISFHAQLSSIVETMARSTLMQVCKLVDEDSTELQLELSRLLEANSALVEKVSSLECELTIVRSDAPRMGRSYRSVGVQTARCREADACGPPTIEGIFGNDWCMNLWKDRDPYSVERYTDSPSRSPDKSAATLSDHITVTEIKEEDFLEDAASSFCLQETVRQHAEHEVGFGEQHEQLSVGYSVDGSACSLSFDRDVEPLVSAGGIEEPSLQVVSIDDTEEAFSTHIIPIEEEEDDDDDDDDDDVQFVQESQQDATLNSVVGHNQQVLPADNTDSGSHLDEDSHGAFDNLQTASRTNSHKFPCTICSRTFFHKGTLTHHMKSHKSNYCTICQQHFPHRSKLNSHSCVPPVSTQGFSKACDLCGKVFANPSALRIHYVVHTGEKPYMCSLCGKGFTQKGNLKCHLRIHTGERPFHCVKCGKTFTQKVNLNHHLMAHRNREFVGSRSFSMKYLRPSAHQISQ